MAEENLVRFIVADIDHVSRLKKPPPTIWLVASTPFDTDSSQRVVKAVYEARKAKVQFISTMEINVYLGSSAVDTSTALFASQKGSGSGGTSTKNSQEPLGSSVGL